jgi:hypothetical protein
VEAGCGLLAMCWLVFARQPNRGGPRGRGPPRLGLLHCISIDIRICGSARFGMFVGSQARRVRTSSPGAYDRLSCLFRSMSSSRPQRSTIL